MTATASRFLELARRVSLRSDYQRYKIGAVIARKSHVLGVGFNQRKTHPRSPSEFKYLHAEVAAALGIPLPELQRAAVYVYRERRDGRPGLSRPCAACQRFLSELGVRVAYFTTESGFGKMSL
jgi:cytidine deaminase